MLPPGKEVVETVPFDVILSAGIGLAVAWAGKAQVRLARSGFWNRQLLVVACFQLLVFCPLGAYLYLFHGDWSWNYFLDPGQLPQWMGFVAIGAYAVAAIAGFAVGARLVRTDRTGVLVYAIAAVCGVLGLYFLVFATRFWWVGSFAEFHGVAGHPGMRALPVSELGHVFFVVGPVFVGVLLWLLVTQRLHGLRLERAAAALDEETRQKS